MSVTLIDSFSINQQLAFLVKGPQHIKLLRAATTKDGIRVLTADQKKEAIARFNNSAAGLDVVKFVPASGAATRMFKRIFVWIENPTENRKAINDFFKNAEKLAFFEDWVQKANELDVETFESGFESKVKWLNILVKPEGLNYAQLPKVVIPFHSYENSATPVMEHLTEVLKMRSEGQKSRIHFTVSEEHKILFENEVMAAFVELECTEDEVEVTYSTQKPTTDTVAIDKKGKIISAGAKPFTRPGGHGSLIHNLNDLDADFAFLKNIDNVCHQRLMDETIDYKKMLGGIMLEVRGEFMGLHQQVGKGLVDAVSIDRVRDKWKLRVPRDYVKLKEYLKRPIRVCGMVKNEGEPGGGPFWCLDRYTGESLQIVEQAQVDRKTMRQEMILSSATHFNPVDLVCCLRDLEGNKINLLQFVDNDQYLIAEKSLNGKEIQALEWPGLWNGAMANWVTVFVEVPISTFNPVKELADLFRPNHLGIV
jgi:hypothetical protein